MNVYFDNAATTRLSDEVLEEMKPYLQEEYGNPSAMYSLGRKTKKAIETARERVATAIGAEPEEIYFTSGGSESDNWAIRGTAFALKRWGRHIITSSIEHPAVYNTCKKLEREKFLVNYLPVDEFGKVRKQDFIDSLRPDTIFASIMTANNEIGTIEPVEELATIAHERGIVFHTDAVQAIGHVKFNMQYSNIDLLSLSGHKFHAPKGVGALYIRKDTETERLICGGEQERNLRAGTENVAGIVGLGKAIEIASSTYDDNTYVCGLRNKLASRIFAEIQNVHMNGDTVNGLPNILSVSFKGIESEALLLRLDMQGICASAGSACMTGSFEPSRTLQSINVPDVYAYGTARFSLSKYNTAEEVDYVVDKLKSIVQDLRKE